ncbi:MAG TPA: ice-binding family protein [Pseudonocardia sp.]
MAWAASVQAPVGLGTATSFAVLAGATATNTGPSMISGDVGVSPGTAVTGFPPGVVTNGTIHSADAVAAQAQADLTTAYNDAAGRTPADAVTTDLGGQTLAPGVYKAASSMGLTGTVTLDAGGNPNAVFIFQAGSTLITASNSTVALINGGSPCNVYWQVGSSATLGTGTTFIGTILALTSASVQTGTTVAGRVLARNGQVSLDTNRITRPNCATLPPGGTTPPIVLPPITTPPIVIGPITVPPISLPPIAVPPITPPGGGGGNGGGGNGGGGNGGGGNGGGGNGGGGNGGGGQNGGGQNGGGGNGGGGNGGGGNGNGHNGGDHNGDHNDHNGDHGDHNGDHHHGGDNSSDNGGDQNAGGDNGDDNSASGGGNGPSDHATTGGQVTKVPVGSVDTGDGSTTGTDPVYYLLTGGLLLAGAGAALTRRLRREG